MAEQANREEGWVPTTCYGCFPSCAIQVKQKDGKVVASRGDPAVYSTLGKCCGKSVSRVADLYHPNRLTRPLLRTNPKKGIGVDPQWKEIGWDEATDIVVERLGKVLRDDPRKLVMGSMDMNNYFFQVAFSEAFGSPNSLWHGATMCGGGLHTVFFHTLGTINSEPDAPRCDYLVQWGSQYGFGANNNPIVGIREMAEARKRGARLVVVDPICSHAAAKADEWIPIVPGTDGALGLAVANLLVNELGIYDETFLANKTNAPYLIGDDGRYVRDPESGKPLMWDAEETVARAFDDPAVRDPALEGEYEVHGKACRPAFSLLKEHLKKYPADEVSRITEIPADTIRRFAREFGEAARIGATIEYEGHILPLRPACIETKRGGTQHKGGFWNVYSIILSNILVGAMNVPGGLLGTHPKGIFGQWDISACEDGLLQTNLCEIFADVADYYRPYPPEKPRPPETMELRELIPCSVFRASLEMFTLDDPERFCIPYKPEALIVWRLNPMMTLVDPKAIGRALEKLDFILAFSWHLDETDEYADLVIPETHDFERWWPFPANLPAGLIAPGPGPWYGQIVQPIVDPPEGVPHWADFMTDVAERLGFLPEMNRILNEKSGLVMSETLCLDTDKKYTVEEVAKRTVCMFTGQEEFDPALFEKTSAVHFYDKTPQEAFPGPFTDARIPVYFEHFIDMGLEVEKVTRGLGMDWWDTSTYHPMPEWHPCQAHEMDDSEYDLLISISKLPLHSHSITSENPWVDDISKRNPLDYNVLLHTSVAEKKGIRDGDWVWVESDIARVKGKVRVTECVHPKVVGAFGLGGRWGREKNVSRGKGVHFNSLMRMDWDKVDTLCGQLDYCAKVKVYKA